MGIKLVISDIDGTLIDKDEIMSPGIDELAGLIREHNIKLTLASGRTPPMMSEFTQRLNITLPTIVCNGSAAYNNGSYIWNDFLDPIDMKPAIHFADSLGMAIILCDGEKEMAYRHNAYIQKQIDLFGRYREIFRPTEAEFPFVKIQKLLIIDPQHPGRVDSVIEQFDFKHGNFNIVRYDARGIEVMPDKSSKGSAIRRLSKYLGVDLKDVLAIGNEINDVDMLQTAGIGAAVANAAAGLKEQADYVCRQDTVYGVIEAIKKFCLDQPAALQV